MTLFDSVTIQRVNASLYDLMWWDLQLSSLNAQAATHQLGGKWPTLVLDNLGEFKNVTAAVGEIVDK